MDNIEAGDSVTHKTRIINGGLAFNVIEVNGDKALCSYFDNDTDQTMRKEYFDVKDLRLVHKHEGGFSQ